MYLFSSKIDPYSSFTINLGPLYVERVFDSQLTRQGVGSVNSMRNSQRFEQYVSYLRHQANVAGARRKIMTHFYRGHFYLQLANCSTSEDWIQHYSEKALCFFQIYLESGRQRDESWYYAQWQVGMLQEVLNYSWSEAEESLIRASNLDKCRGEANKRIIEHYIRCKDWKAAHHFSTIAMDRFLDKNPAAHRRWFVDFDVYNWQALRLHRMIRYKLGFQHEKNTINGPASTQTSPKQAEL